MSNSYVDSATPCVAAIFRYSHLDQNLIYYPALGYLSVMTATSGGGVLQAGWSQLAGALLGGVVVALALTCLGDNPVIAALCYIATLLVPLAFGFSNGVRGIKN